MIGDTLFNIAHAAVAEFDRVFAYDFMELVVCYKRETTKREEGRSLGLTPHSAEMLPPTLVKKFFTLLNVCFPANNRGVESY